MVQKLIEGFQSFVEKEYESHIGTMNELVEQGQNPDYFMISCIDSRSNPGTIFNPKPGTFFAHKAMGAIVRPYKKGTALAAALQFALDYNKVREIIILGHTGCGAVAALIEGIEDEEISSFLNVAQAGLENAKHKCGPDCSSQKLHRYAEEQIVLQSANNLAEYPSVKRALNDGRVHIRPWLFDMEHGSLFEYSDTQDKFVLITDRKNA